MDTNLARLRWVPRAERHDVLAVMREISVRHEHPERLSCHVVLAEGVVFVRRLLEGKALLLLLAAVLRFPSYAGEGRQSLLRGLVVLREVSGRARDEPHQREKQDGHRRRPRVD